MSKRLLDIVGSAALLLVLLPVLVVVGVAVRVSSSGPALFRQQRIGAGGRPFTLYKFRSMRRDAEQVLRSDRGLFERYVANDHKLSIGDDPRITPIGRLLRKTSIDELPQLWNVLKGDMSLVGPRPVLAPELARYGDRVDAYCATRPGITGAWQVAGRSKVAYADRIRLDIEYVDLWSLGKDLGILVRTPVAVLCCRGAL